jgi:hypothetical protein
MLTPRSLRQLATPPYFFQPLQILKRLRLEYLWRSKTDAAVRLPWGLSIKVNPHEAVGKVIAAQGLYEKEVTSERSTSAGRTVMGSAALVTGRNM